MAERFHEKAIPFLLPQAEGFFLDGGWVVMWYDGKPMQGKSRDPLEPDMDRKLYAASLCERLNREIWLDGKWAVAWTDFDGGTGRPRKLQMIYLEHEGDIVFTIDVEDRWPVMQISEDEYMQHAFDAYAEYRRHLRDVGVKPSQERRAMLGEPSVDPDAMPDVPNTGLD